MGPTGWTMGLVADCGVIFSVIAAAAKPRPLCLHCVYTTIDANRFVWQTWFVNDNQSNSVPDVEVHDLAEIQGQMQRPARYVNLDGSFDLGWGTAILCLSLVPYINAILPKAIWSSPWTSWIAYLPLFCGAIAPYAVGKIVKRFVTWPRSGYVRNPNEITLGYLILIMIFGLALGDSFGMVYVLTMEIRKEVSHTGGAGNFHDIIYHVIRLLISFSLAVYLGRKAIRKRRPLPVAYDSTVINQQLSQTVAGRKCVRTVKLTLFFLLIGLPIMVCGVVFGLMYLGHTAMRHALFQWPQLGVASFLIGTNAILFLMGNGVVIREQKWKWLALAGLILAPILLAPLIPYPANQSELLPTIHPVMLSLGMVWFLSGVITLIIFIRHNPPPATETP